MSKFYLAARFSRKQELLEYAKVLESLGHTNVSGWLVAEEETEDLESPEAQQYAIKDVNDILDSEFMLNFTEKQRIPNATRGGRHVEGGIYIGLKCRGDWHRKLFVIGPVENIFHSLPEINDQFEDFNGFIAAHTNGDVTL